MKAILRCRVVSSTNKSIYIRNSHRCWWFQSLAAIERPNNNWFNQQSGYRSRKWNNKWCKDSHTHLYIDRLCKRIESGQISKIGLIKHTRAHHAPVPFKVVPYANSSMIVIIPYFDRKYVFDPIVFIICQNWIATEFNVFLLTCDVRPTPKATEKYFWRFWTH